MKKLFFGLALLAASSLSMMAQNPGSCQKSACNAEAKCTSAQVCKQVCNDCPGPGKCQNPKCVVKGKGQPKGQCRITNGLEGITLTDSQKSKISEIIKNQRAANEKADALQKEQKKLDKAQKEQRRNEIRKMRMEDRKKTLAELKSVLTPEQYSTFLENNFIQGGNQNPGKAFAKHGKKMGKGHGHNRRHGKSDKTPRSNKNSSQNLSASN